MPGSRRRKKTLLLRTASQVRAVRTPLRQEIVEAIGRLGTCSVKELAAEMNRIPASLYYHIHALESAGILRRKGSRSAGTQTEGLYELSAERIFLDRKSRGRDYLSAVADSHKATLRTAERELVRSLERSAGTGGATDASTAVLRLTARLAPADAERARRMLMETAKFIGERSDPGASDEFALTAVFVRLPPRK